MRRVWRAVWRWILLAGVMGLGGCTTAHYDDGERSISIARFHPLIDTKIGSIRVLPGGGFEVDNFSSESVAVRALAELAKKAAVLP